MPAPTLFVAGSIRATDPVSLNSQRAVPSVASDCALTAATLAVGAIGVAGNGDGDGLAGNGVAVGLGDGVGLGIGATRTPPPNTPKPSTATRRTALAASESSMDRPGPLDRRATRCHG